MGRNNGHLNPASKGMGVGGGTNGSQGDHFNKASGGKPGSIADRGPPVHAPLELDKLIIKPFIG